MQVSSINAQVAFTIFDSWLKAVEHRIHTQKGGVAAPAIDAAFQAFNAYAATVEAGNSAMIAGVAAQLGYQPNPAGTGVCSTQQMAPFLALNLLA